MANLCKTEDSLFFGKDNCAVPFENIRAILLFKEKTKIDANATMQSLQTLINQGDLIILKGMIDITSANVAAVELTQADYSETVKGMRIGENLIFPNDMCIDNKIKTLVNKKFNIIYVVGGDIDGVGGRFLGKDIQGESGVGTISVSFTIFDKTANARNATTLVTSIITMVHEEEYNSFKHRQIEIPFDITGLIQPTGLKLIKLQTEGEFQLEYECTGGNYPSDDANLLASIFVNGIKNENFDSTHDDNGKLTITFDPVLITGDRVTISIEDEPGVAFSDTISYVKS